MAGGAAPGAGGLARPEWASLAARLIGRLGERGQTLAVAESLTGGMLGAAITSVPGASAVFRGGVIAYATDLKAVLLSVPVALLDSRGAVDPDVAAAMADGVRDRLGADVGIATTGVAGPDPADGHPPGAVYVAVSGVGSGAGRREGRALALAGSRDEIRSATVTEALRLAWNVISGEERG